VRLIALFDNLLFSHLDRTRVMSERVRTLLFSQKNGSVPGAVLVDGFVSGSWSLIEKRRKTVLTIKAFTRLSRSAHKQLEHEV
jgi:Winged helix DNA-binding domain